MKQRVVIGVALFFAILSIRNSASAEAMHSRSATFNVEVQRDHSFIVGSQSVCAHNLSDVAQLHALASRFDTEQEAERLRGIQLPRPYKLIAVSVVDEHGDPIVRFAVSDVSSPRRALIRGALSTQAKVTPSRVSAHRKIEFSRPETARLADDVHRLIVSWMVKGMVSGDEIEVQKEMIPDDRILGASNGTTRAPGSSDYFGIGVGTYEKIDSYKDKVVLRRTKKDLVLPSFPYASLTKLGLDEVRYEPQHAKDDSAPVVPALVSNLQDRNHDSTDSSPYERNVFKIPFVFESLVPRVHELLKNFLEYAVRTSISEDGTLSSVIRLSGFDEPLNSVSFRLLPNGVHEVRVENEFVPEILQKKLQNVIAQLPNGSIVTTRTLGVIPSLFESAPNAHLLTTRSTSLGEELIYYIGTRPPPLIEYPSTPPVAREYSPPFDAKMEADRISSTALPNGYQLHATPIIRNNQRAAINLTLRHWPSPEIHRDLGTATITPFVVTAGGGLFAYRLVDMTDLRASNLAPEVARRLAEAVSFGLREGDQIGIADTFAQLLDPQKFVQDANYDGLVVLRRTHVGIEPVPFSYRSVVETTDQKKPVSDLYETQPAARAGEHPILSDLPYFSHTTVSADGQSVRIAAKNSLNEPPNAVDFQFRDGVHYIRFENENPMMRGQWESIWRLMAALPDGSLFVGDTSLAMRTLIEHASRPQLIAVQRHPEGLKFVLYNGEDWLPPVANLSPMRLTEESTLRGAAPDLAGEVDSLNEHMANVVVTSATPTQYEFDVLSSIPLYERQPFTAARGRVRVNPVTKVRRIEITMRGDTEEVDPTPNRTEVLRAEIRGTLLMKTGLPKDTLLAAPEDLFFEYQLAAAGFEPVARVQKDEPTAHRDEPDANGETEEIWRKVR